MAVTVPGAPRHQEARSSAPGGGRLDRLVLLSSNASDTNAKGLNLVESSRPRSIIAVSTGNIYVLRMLNDLKCVRYVAAAVLNQNMTRNLVNAMAVLLLRQGLVFGEIVSTNTLDNLLSDEARDLAGSLPIGPLLNINHLYVVARLGEKLDVLQLCEGSMPPLHTC